MATATTTKQPRKQPAKPATRESTTRAEREPVDEAAQGVRHLIESLGRSERSALDAGKRFVDTVNDAFPDIGDDGPRQQIIDAAFEMTAQVVDASNRLAMSIVETAESTLERLARPES